MSDILKNNRILLYFYELFSTFVLYYAVDTLFYLERGISSSEYILFVVVTFVIQLLFELPSGVLADKYGKKKILIFSQIFFLIATIIFIYSCNFLMFILGTIVMALQKCFSTGIVNSLLYESLDNKLNFNKCLFIKNVMSYGAYMLAMPLGGFIAEKFGIVYTYYFSLIPAIISISLLFFIKSSKDQNNRLSISKWQIIKNGFSEINKNKLLKNIILINGMLLAVIKLVEESHPDYSINIGISEFGIGIYTALILLFCIMGNFIGTKINSNYVKTFILMNPIIVGIFIIILGFLNNKYGILFLLLYYLFSESFDIIIVSIIHHNISSKSRVTIESITSIIQCLIGIILGFCTSIFLEFFKINVVYIILGIILIIYCLIINIHYAYKKN